MVRRLLNPRTTALAGTAASGLVAGHLLSYALAVPGSAHREDVLAATGHGYVGDAALIAIGATALAVFASAALGFRRGRRGLAARPSVGRTATRLAVLQLGGFAAAEVAERLLSGGGFGGLTARVLAVGLVVQLAAAVVGACLVHLIDRAAEAIGRFIRPRPKAGRAAAPRAPASDVRVCSRLLDGAHPARAPPLPHLRLAS